MKIEEKSCGCIIIENRKVLLIKQTSGIWGFPKGHVEHDETEEETAKREVKEETNIDVEIRIYLCLCAHHGTQQHHNC
jgi:ADP-ribose pyrophosphatase YjhB (NUDIX family)